MRNSSANVLAIIGIVMVVAGLAGFALPRFTTRQTTEVARIGDIKLETTQSNTRIIPPLLSGGVLLAGVLLIGAGVLRRR